MSYCGWLPFGKKNINRAVFPILGCVSTYAGNRFFSAGPPWNGLHVIFFFWARWTEVVFNFNFFKKTLKYFFFLSQHHQAQYQSVKIWLGLASLDLANREWLEVKNDTGNWDNRNNRRVGSKDYCERSAPSDILSIQ